MEDKAIAPSLYPKAITPSDTDDIYTIAGEGPQLARGLYIGDVDSGDEVTILTSDNEEVLFKGCVAGTWIPVRFKRIMSTGTTAESLIAFF